jgi:hypothetical protein
MESASYPLFEVHESITDKIWSLSLGSTSVGKANIEDVFDEMGEFEFVVLRPERNVAYAVFIGDVPALPRRGRDERWRSREDDEWTWIRETRFSHAGPAPGISLSYAPYFEGCSGPVEIVIKSRPIDNSDKPSICGIMSVHVSPSTLTEQRLRTMRQALDNISAALVFTSLSRQKRGVELLRLGARHTAAAPVIELEKLRVYWRELEKHLQGMYRSPARTLKKRAVERVVTSMRDLNTSSLIGLLEDGVHPDTAIAAGSIGVRLRTLSQEMAETEHGMIRFTLDTVAQKAADCVERVKTELHEAAARRNRLPLSLTKYQQTAVLRAHDDEVAFLTGLLDDARRIMLAVQGHLESPMFRKIRPTRFLRPTRLFLTNANYNAIYNAARRFMTNTYWVLTDRVGSFAVKTTNQLYEQWVFLQMYGALLAAGCTTQGSHTLFNFGVRGRLYVDFRPDTCVRCDFDENWCIDLSFKPTIYCRDEATTMGAELCVENGEEPLTPTLLMNIKRKNKPSASVLIVINAIYDASQWWIKGGDRRSPQSFFRMWSCFDLQGAIADGTWTPLSVIALHAQPVSCGMKAFESDRWTEMGRWEDARGHRAFVSLPGIIGLLPSDTEGPTTGLVVDATAAEFVRKVLKLAMATSIPSDHV